MAELKIKNKIVKSMSIQKDIVSNADYVSTLTTDLGVGIADSIAGIKIIGTDNYLFDATFYTDYDPAVGETIEFNISDFSQIADYSTVTTSSIASIINIHGTNSWVANFDRTNKDILGSKIIQALKNNGKLDLKLVYKITKKEINSGGTYVADATIDLEHTTLDGVPINSSTTPISSLTIDGHKYSFEKNIVITKDDVEKHVFDHTTWGTDHSTAIDKTYRMTYHNVEYVDGVNPPTSDGSAVSAWNEFKKDTLNSDLSDSIERLINEVSSPTIKSISGAAADRVTWTKISFPNLETCSININYSSSLTDVTLPEKFNTPDQLTKLFGSAANIAKITFHWLDASGNIVIKGTFATIDTTAKLQGLDVTYTKSTGIVDGEEVDATVVFDATVVDHINGVTANFQVGDVKLLNPDRTVTEDDAETYIKANLADTGLLDVTGWPALHPGTKLYTPNLHITKGDDIVYTVQADSGFTVNGGATVDYTINIPDFVPLEKWIAYSNITQKFIDQDGVEFYKPSSTSNDSGTIMNSDGDKWYAVYRQQWFKNGTQLFTSSAKPEVSAIDNDGNLYTVADDPSRQNILKNNVVLFATDSSNFSDGIWIDKNNDVYALSNKGTYYKNGTIVKKDITNGASSTIDSDGNIYWSDSNGSVFKNDVLLFKDSSITNAWVRNIRVDKNNDVYYNHRDEIRKNGNLLYKTPTQASAYGMLIIASNQLVYYGNDGIYLDNVKVSDEKVIRFGCSDEYGGRTGNW